MEARTRGDEAPEHSIRNCPRWHTAGESERTRNKHIWTLGLLKMAKVGATELSGGERRRGVFKNSGQKSSKLNKNDKF